ncbi:MAG: biotin/lipoyl-containing protein, partial [Solirubrobacterales bacterium]
MAEEIVMPRLSDSMEEGTILKWMKSVGDEVALGEELVEIETDKANMVFEADAAGTLIEIVASEGDTLPIGEVIARVGEAGEAPSGDGASGDESEAAGGDGESEAAVAASPTQPSPAPGDGRVKASPIARRVAGEKGVDISSLQGSGPGGRII